MYEPFESEQFADVSGISVEMEQLRIGVQQALSPEILASAKAEILWDRFTNMLIVSARGFVWSKQLDHVTIEYPADWWQAVKERWFPEWLLRRYPVRCNRHDIDVKVIYPELHKQYAIPDAESHLRIFKEDHYG